MKFIDQIESEFLSSGYSSFTRVDEVILWVGNNDNELNRTLDFSFPHSLRIQVGGATNYFEEAQLSEQKVFEMYLEILSNQIVETLSYSNQKHLKTEYKIENPELSIDLGMSSTLRQLWKTKNREETVIHEPILNKKSLLKLKTKLKQAYNIV